MTKDYYSLLNVEKEASIEEIKKAFVDQANKVEDIEEASQSDRLIDLYEAYAMLSDVEKRTLYNRFDEHGKAGLISKEMKQIEDWQEEARNGKPAMSGTDWTMLFADIFGEGIITVALETLKGIGAATIDVGEKIIDHITDIDIDL